MKEFILPEIEICDLSPCQTTMDDITSSGEIQKFRGKVQIVADPASASGDYADWVARK